MSSTKAVRDRLALQNPKNRKERSRVYADMRSEIQHQEAPEEVDEYVWRQDFLRRHDAAVDEVELSYQPKSHWFKFVFGQIAVVGGLLVAAANATKDWVYLLHPLIVVCIVAAAGFFAFGRLMPRHQKTCRVLGIGSVVCAISALFWVIFFGKSPSAESTKAPQSESAQEGPREKLTRRGLGWNNADFSATLDRSDIEALELYMAGKFRVPSSIIERYIQTKALNRAATSVLLKSQELLDSDVCLIDVGLHNGLYKAMSTNTDALDFYFSLCNRREISQRYGRILGNLKIAEAALSAQERKRAEALEACEKEAVVSHAYLVERALNPSTQVGIHESLGEMWVNVLDKFDSKRKNQPGYNPDKELFKRKIDTFPVCRLPECWTLNGIKKAIVGVAIRACNEVIPKVPVPNPDYKARVESILSWAKQEP